MCDVTQSCGTLPTYTLAPATMISTADQFIAGPNMASLDLYVLDACGNLTTWMQCRTEDCATYCSPYLLGTEKGSQVKSSSARDPGIEACHASVLQPLGAKAKSGLRLVIAHDTLVK